MTTFTNFFTDSIGKSDIFPFNTQVVHSEVVESTRFALQLKNTTVPGGRVKWDLLVVQYCCYDSEMPFRTRFIAQYRNQYSLWEYAFNPYPPPGEGDWKLTYLSNNLDSPCRPITKHFDGASAQQALAVTVPQQSTAVNFVPDDDFCVVPEFECDTTPGTYATFTILGQDLTTLRVIPNCDSELAMDVTAYMVSVIADYLLEKLGLTLVSVDYNPISNEMEISLADMLPVIKAKLYCCPCPPGQVYDPDMDACKPACPPGTEWDPFTETCVPPPCPNPVMNTSYGVSYSSSSGSFFLKGEFCPGGPGDAGFGGLEGPPTPGNDPSVLPPPSVIPYVCQTPSGLGGCTPANFWADLSSSPLNSPAPTSITKIYLGQYCLGNEPTFSLADVLNNGSEWWIVIDGEPIVPFYKTVSTLLRMNFSILRIYHDTASEDGTQSNCTLPIGGPPANYNYGPGYWVGVRYTTEGAPRFPGGPPGRSFWWGFVAGPKDPPVTAGRVALYPGQDPSWVEGQWEVRSNTGALVWDPTSYYSNPIADICLVYCGPIF